MLQNIRDNAQGTIAKVIVGVIVFTFALFGVDSIIGSLGGEPQVATVNGEDITEREFASVVDQQKRQLFAQLGENADPSLLDESLIRKQVLQGLIDQLILRQAAQEQGFVVTDALVNQVITTIPRFQVNGKFENAQLLSYLNSAGQTLKQFKALLKKDILLGQLRNGLIGSEFALPNELAQIVAISNETRDGALVTFNVSDYIDNITVTDEEVKAYFNDHKADYQKPEEVDVSYILLDKKAIAEQVKIDDEAIKKLYEQEVASFVPSEERHAEHILIKVDDKTSKEEALKQIKEIQAKLASGEKFEDLAKEFSQDTGSASSGGDLGFAGKGTFVPEFEEALFKLKEGQVSEPVLTEYGYHLIKLVEVRKNAVPSMAELAPTLEEDYKTAEAEKQYVDLSEKLANITYTTADLTDASDELGLPILKAEGVKRVGEDRQYLANAKVRDEIFSEDLRSGDGNTSVIELNKDKSIVLHVDGYHAARPLTLDEARQDVVRHLKHARASALAAEKGKKALNALVKGEKNDKLQWKEEKNIHRGASVFPPKAIKHLFTMETDSTHPSYEGVTLNTGDFAIVRLDKVNKGDIAKLSAVEKKQLSRMLASSDGVAFYKLYEAYLKSKAEIEKP